LKPNKCSTPNHLYTGNTNFYQDHAETPIRVVTLSIFFWWKKLELNERFRKRNQRIQNAKDGQPADKKEEETRKKAFII
jgi:hypothetical protein